MQPVWDFLADHRFILWMLLGAGIFGILQLTLLYDETLRLAACYLRRMHRLLKTLPHNEGIILSNRVLRWYRKRYRSRWLWFAGLLQAILMIAAAVVGLVVL